MKAFHNDPLIKDKYLARVTEHEKADEIVKGKYWENGKGCAVGCTIHSGEHAAYETELGIPEWLARCEDTFFENLPNELAKTWPKRFLEAVNPGADLEKVKTPFIVYILNENLKALDSLKVDAEFKDVISAIEQTKTATKQMIEAHKSGGDLSAARSAESAARSAAWSAAWSAAESAAWSAESAARSAESAARSAAWSAAFIQHSEKLLELMKGCEL